MKRIIQLIALVMLFGTLNTWAEEPNIYRFANAGTIVFRDFRDVSQIMNAAEVSEEMAQHALQRMVAAGRGYVAQESDEAEVVDLIDPSLLSGGAVWIYIKGQPGYWITSMGRLR